MLTINKLAELRSAVRDAGLSPEGGVDEYASRIAESVDGFDIDTIKRFALLSLRKTLGADFRAERDARFGPPRGEWHKDDPPEDVFAFSDPTREVSWHDEWRATQDVATSLTHSVAKVPAQVAVCLLAEFGMGDHLDLGDERSLVAVDENGRLKNVTMALLVGAVIQALKSRCPQWFHNGKLLQDLPPDVSGASFDEQEVARKEAEEAEKKKEAQERAKRRREAEEAELHDVCQRVLSEDEELDTAVKDLARQLQEDGFQSLKDLVRSGGLRDTCEELAKDVWRYLGDDDFQVEKSRIPREERLLRKANEVAQLALLQELQRLEPSWFFETEGNTPRLRRSLGSTLEVSRRTRADQNKDTVLRHIRKYAEKYGEDVVLNAVRTWRTEVTEVAEVPPPPPPSDD